MSWRKSLYMAEHSERTRRHLELFALVLSVFMGTVNLGMFLWKGGALVQEFETMKVRVKTIEDQGSRSFSVHEQLDNMRESQVSERLAKLERIVDLLPSFD